MLPIVPLDRATTEIGGATVEYRSLSRDEVGLLAGFDDVAAAEAFTLSRSTGVSEEEARAWRQQVGSRVVDGLLRKIAAISGLTPGEGPGGNP